MKNLNLWECSEYIPGFECVNILNIQRLSISMVTQGLPVFVNMTVLNVSGCNYGSVLNITGIQTWQVSAYASFMQGSEYGWIMPE